MPRNVDKTEGNWQWYNGDIGLGVGAAELLKGVHGDSVQRRGDRGEQWERKGRAEDWVISRTGRTGTGEKLTRLQKPASPVTSGKKAADQVQSKAQCEP